MLCEELSLRVSTLLKGLIRRHTQKKKICSIQQKLAHRDCTEKYSVRVPAAQFGIAYCPTIKGLDIHTLKKNITLFSYSKLSSGNFHRVFFCAVSVCIRD